MWKKFLAAAAFWSFLPISSNHYARADALADYYRANPITIVVGFGVGGGYDVYARTLARHMGKHMPGEPGFVVRNMPGAGSMTAVNYIFNNAPKDGTQFGTFSRSVPTQPLFDMTGVQFEALKLNWIGSPASEVSVVFARIEKNFRTIEDLRTREMVVPASGHSADSAVYPFILNALLGTKMKVVTGYQGSGDFMLAIERNEVDGMGGSSILTLRSTRPQWLKEKKIEIILQISLRKHADYQDKPLALDFVTDPNDRKVMELIFSRQEVAFPFAAPPGVPIDRIAALRRGFMATLNDPLFVQEAEKVGLEVSPISGDEVTKILTTAYSTPPGLVERAKKAVVPK